MVYGYIRVSTDKQTVENQRFEIKRICKSQNIKIDMWYEETISGAKSVNKRQLGSLLNNIKKGDLIICSELSRLGRNLLMLMNIINHCLEVGACIWTIKENFKLDNSIQSKVMVFAFGLAAEIERDMISQRTKEALARVKSEGKILGHRTGEPGIRKLTGREKEISKMVVQGMNNVQIGKALGVHRNTVSIFKKVCNI